MELDVSLLFHADPHLIRHLYLGVGENYQKTLLLPELQSAVRGLTSEVLRFDDIEAVTSNASFLVH